MAKAKLTKEQIEYNRLAELYQDIPENKRKLVEGLLVQAARLRVSLDNLWEDMKQHGETEMFRQGSDAFKHERPEAKIFTARDKSYQAIIKQLNEQLPNGSVSKGFSKLLDD